MEQDEESGKTRMDLAFVANHLSYNAKSVSEAQMDPLSNEVISVVLHFIIKRELFC